MSKYHRAKREDNIDSRKQLMTINIGSVEDSYESLVAMCKDKSYELLKTIDLEDSNEMKVIFWTEDIPELIGISTFTKNEAGITQFKFDYSQTTLL